MPADELAKLIEGPKPGGFYSGSSLGPGATGCVWDSSNGSSFVTLKINSPGKNLAGAVVTSNLSPTLYAKLDGVGDTAGLFKSADGMAIIAAQGDVVVELTVNKAPSVTQEQLQASTQAVLDGLTS